MTYPIKHMSYFSIQNIIDMFNINTITELK